MPPLRERKEDIPDLSLHFLQQFSNTMRKKIQGFSKDAMQQLVEYDWPGNVRELRNVIERVVLMAEEELVTRADLPTHGVVAEEFIKTNRVPRTAEQLKQIKKQRREKLTADIERKFLLEAHERNEWNITNAAKDTGMDRRNSQNLMRKHNLKP